MPPKPISPASPDEWIDVCHRELKNLSGAYAGKLTSDAKIDHAVRAVEAALKAIIWKHEGFTSWPGKDAKQYRFLYGHKLDVMLDRCGLKTRLTTSRPHWASWLTILNAVGRQTRYSPTPSLPTEDEANEVAKATRHPDTGIVPWLLKKYRGMT